MMDRQADVLLVERISVISRDSHVVLDVLQKIEAWGERAWGRTRSCGAPHPYLVPVCEAFAIWSIPARMAVPQTSSFAMA